MWLMFAVFAGLTFGLCSCKEQMQVFQEKVILEMEFNQCQAEAQELDAKFASLGLAQPDAMARLDQQITTAEGVNKPLAAEVAELSSRLEALDQALKTFKPKVDALKTARP